MSIEWSVVCWQCCSLHWQRVCPKPKLFFCFDVRKSSLSEMHSNRIFVGFAFLLETNAFLPQFDDVVDYLKTKYAGRKQAFDGLDLHHNTLWRYRLLFLSLILKLEYTRIHFLIWLTIWRQHFAFDRMLRWFLILFMYQVICLALVAFFHVSTERLLILE